MARVRYSEAEKKLMFSIALKALTAKQAQKEDPKTFNSLLIKFKNNTTKKTSIEQKIHEALSEITIEK